MSEFSKLVALDNIEQMLLETMADFLDGETLQQEEAIEGFKDPVLREESELHMRMAKAAMAEYKRTLNL